MSDRRESNDLRLLFGGNARIPTSVKCQPTNRLILSCRELPIAGAE